MKERECVGKRVGIYQEGDRNLSFTLQELFSSLPNKESNSKALFMTSYYSKTQQFSRFFNFIFDPFKIKKKKKKNMKSESSKNHLLNKKQQTLSITNNTRQLLPQIQNIVCGENHSRALISSSLISTVAPLINNTHIFTPFVL